MFDMFPDADLYFALQDEPYAHAMLDLHKPKKSILYPRKDGTWWRDDFYNRHVQFSQENLELKRQSLNTIDGKRFMGKWDNILRMFYSVQACYEILEGHYDYVIRSRPDVRIKSQISLPSSLDENEIAVPNFYCGDYVWSDKFYVGRQEFSTKVANLFTDIPEVMANFPITSDMMTTWMVSENVLHWAIKHWYGGKTTLIPEWNIDRYKVNYKNFYTN